MKNKKGNVAAITIIIVIVAITAGVIGWMFAKKTQAPTQQIAITQQPKPAVQPTSPVVEKPKEKIVYSLNFPATLSPYERNKTGVPNDAYSEIYALDLETNTQILLFSDKDSPFYIVPGYDNTDRFIEPNKILLETRERAINNTSSMNVSSYKIIDLEDNNITDLPNLPLPDKFKTFFENRTYILADGKYVYGAENESESESAIFICNNDLTNMKKIYSTPIYGNEGINAMAVSKDGQKIAFSIGQNGLVAGRLVPNTYVMNIDGSNLKKVFNKQSEGDVIEWLPDNNHFIFTNGYPAKLSIISIDGDKEPLNNFSGTSLKVSPDGSRILFFSDSNVTVSDINGGNVNEVSTVGGTASATIIGWIVK